MHLHIVDMDHAVAIQVQANSRGGKRRIEGDRIESNVLENSGRPAVAMAIGTNGPTPGVKNGSAFANGSVNDVTIAHNVIRGFLGDGINAGVAGTHCTLKGLVVEDNTFADNTSVSDPALELDIMFSDNSIVGTRILRNTFTGNGNGITLAGGDGAGGARWQAASGDVVSGTVISQNVFDGNHMALALSGAYAHATGNAVLNTVISNNVFARSAPWDAIDLSGGGPNSNGNRVDGVHIVNDTIAFNAGSILFHINSGKASSNKISHVDVQNTIFWMNNSADVGGPDGAAVAPTIRSSLTGVDPLFVSAQDFHLQAGSPAINAGTASGAPTVDLENGLRDGAPDIGAYEFGATPRP